MQRETERINRQEGRTTHTALPTGKRLFQDLSLLESRICSLPPICSLILPGSRRRGYIKCTADNKLQWYVFQLGHARIVIRRDVRVIAFGLRAWSVSHCCTSSNFSMRSRRQTKETTWKARNNCARFSYFSRCFGWNAVTSAPDRPQRWRHLAASAKPGVIFYANGGRGDDWRQNIHNFGSNRRGLDSRIRRS